MWHEITVAVALLLVIEGLLPFISPGRWRNMVKMAATLDDRSMRVVGFVSMLSGIGLLYLVN